MGTSAMGLLTVIAVSSSVALLLLRYHKIKFESHGLQPPSPVRSCIAASGRRRGSHKKVHFALDVVEPCNNQPIEGRGIDNCKKSLSN
ncbi:hypothetical protein SUGI_0629410 [Cryptomeria japonica]|nr:hypothetical protein SUGI_0629410 [Cryptomeria japonica]